MEEQIKFLDLSSIINQLRFGGGDRNRNILHKALDDLNKLDYRYSIVESSTKAILLVNQCCALISCDDSTLVKTFCVLLNNLIGKQQVVVEGRTLTITIQFLVQCLKVQSNHHVLLALNSLIRNAKLSSCDEGLVQELALILQREDLQENSILLAISCLEAIACLEGDHSKLLNLFLWFLMDKRLDDEVIQSQVFTMCLVGLNNVLLRQNYLDKHLPVVLGLVKSFMLCGLEKITFLPPAKLLPSAMSLPEAPASVQSTKKGGRITKQRKPPKVEAGFEDLTYFEDCLQFESADLSDSSEWSDGSLKSPKTNLSLVNTKVRQSALKLLLNVVKLTDKKMVFSYWSNFIPEDAGAKHHLISCFLHDSSTKARILALNCLLLLINASKDFLAQAELSEKQSFTPFSVVLGLSLKQVHNALCLALQDQYVPVLMQSLKTLAALVQATPYHRLVNSLLITKLVRNVRLLINHKDRGVRSNVLMVLACLLASEPPVQEVQNVLIKDESCWLLEVCLKHLQVEDNAQVKLESLQVLSAMSRNYFEALILTSLPAITTCLDRVILTENLDLKLHAGRTIDFLGQAIAKYEGNNQEKCLDFWQSLLVEGSLVALFQSEERALRAMACDCLGSIGPQIFELLARDKQFLCVTLLFGCSRDEENCVKGAAVRSLAIMVLFPSLREDFGFITDTCQTILRTIDNPNLPLRIKASWALGNLSDCIVLSCLDCQDEFPSTLQESLLKACIKAAKDNDKVKMNAVRALGNLLQLIKRPNDLSFEALNLLKDNASKSQYMKVRWNSCYALSNIIKTNFAIIQDPQPVFSCLCDLVENFRNFKVRINATLALSSVQTRQNYNDHFVSIWKVLLRSLENSQNIQDLTEYKHLDNLVDQICLSLAHLTSLITQEDLKSLENVLFNCECLRTLMRRVMDRLLPEKFSIISRASNHLLSFDDNLVVQNLKRIFSH